MYKYILSFNEIDGAALPLVGGKGLNLGELSKISGICVPEGFCVTTEAFERIITQTPELIVPLGELAALKSGKAGDIAKIGDICRVIRDVIENAMIPGIIEEEILDALRGAGMESAYAIRSSATAEDLPTASFAGQQDTYLNISGEKPILKHISKCWASLYTERAAVYRIQNGFDHAGVRLAVVVQKMVFPEAAGIMFTADPVTSDRKTVSIDAGFGLGEAMVSGLVDPDNYKVRNGKITARRVPEKGLAVFALDNGGTEERPLSGPERSAQVLTDEQALALARAGRRIESYFGCPQDIEWCLRNGEFFFVQSRAITTLYPLPAAGDDKNHIYMSLGHQQMMTDVISPLGASMFRLFLRNLTRQPILEVGGRLYLDVSSDMASPMSRKIFIESGLGSVEGLIQNALRNISGRDEFMAGLAKGMPGTGLTGGGVGNLIMGFFQALGVYIKNDANRLPGVIGRVDAKLRDLEKRIYSESGTGLFDFIRRDFGESYKMLVLDNYGLGALGALLPGWIDKNIKKWLGDDNASDSLLKSVLCNVTTEMGLDLLDVADVARRYPDVVKYLNTAVCGGGGYSDGNGDSGETGDSGDAGDSEDAGDSREAGDSRDAGDTGDTSDIGDIGDTRDIDNSDSGDTGDIDNRDNGYSGYGGSFYSGLARLDGGPETAEAIARYLDKYGARCTGEIDIARTRWAEDPSLIAPMLLNDVNNFSEGAHGDIIAQKHADVRQKADELAERLKKLPSGNSKAKKILKQISVMRNTAGFREYPKFAMMQHFLIYKRALLREAEALTQKGVLREPGDMYFLSLDELREAVAAGRLDYDVIDRRVSEYKTFVKQAPPRVMTSDGEIISGEYGANGGANGGAAGDAEGFPEGSLRGVPVSAGVVEGRANVILRLEDARVEEGDILVTVFTDPSWTALFVSVKGLVTEVGGLMTHGAVVAREYGIPAVVSVQGATKTIQTGRRIRVNGAAGYVEILE